MVAACGRAGLLFGENQRLCKHSCMHDKANDCVLLQMKVSKSQKLLAYTLETQQGFEIYTVHVDDLETGMLNATLALAFIPSFIPDAVIRFSMLSMKLYWQQEEPLTSSLTCIA